MAGQPLEIVLELPARMHEYLRQEMRLAGCVPRQWIDDACSMAGGGARRGRDHLHDIVRIPVPRERNLDLRLGLPKRPSGLREFSNGGRIGRV